MHFQRRFCAILLTDMGASCVLVKKNEMVSNSYLTMAVVMTTMKEADRVLRAYCMDRNEYQGMVPTLIQGFASRRSLAN